MTRLLPFVVAFSASAFGCRPALEPRAARELGCPEPQIELTERQFIQEARGCGKAAVYKYDFAEGDWTSLRDRAAFELSCDLEALTVRVIDSTTFGVSGCGAKAVYKFVRGTGFVMDTISQPGEPPRKAQDDPKD